MMMMKMVLMMVNVRDICIPSLGLLSTIVMPLCPLGD